MIKAPVKSHLLQWALDRAGLTPPNIERKFPRIQEWINGESQPTLRQLEQFAKATRTPLGYFFLEEPPELKLPIPYFRTLEDERFTKPSPNLLETVQTMQRRQSWMRDFLINLGQQPLSFVGSSSTSIQPAKIAEDIRKTLSLEENWAAKSPTWEKALDILRMAMENTGILVVVNSVVGNNTHRRLDPNEFRGFVLVDEYAPLVFVNGADAKAAQMFTLAHELAHVFFGNSAAFDLRLMLPSDNQIEIACNKVAAEFLVPESHLRQAWPIAKDASEPFQLIARHFKVSALVAARRALDAGLISKDEFFAFYSQYKDDQRRTTTQREEGGNFYNNQNLRIGKRFACAVIQAAREGSLLYSEAYRLTGLFGKTFEKYATLLELRGSL